MKIYTRRGDRGRTGLFGGDRVDKHDRRVTAYGEVDELNTHLGLTLATAADGQLDADRLRRVQDDLFTIGARLAAADPERASAKGLIPELGPERVSEIERWIDQLEASLPPLDAFLIPGGSPTGARLHVTRTVCRRAERAISLLATEQDDLRETILPYMNRLSDLLFLLSRLANRDAGIADPKWRP